MTQARERVLEILSLATEPLSAQAIFSRTGTSFDQATVYRTLHYLEDRGYCESFVLYCREHGTERFFSPVRSGEGKTLPHRHWFHCERCHGFSDLGTCAIESLTERYERERELIVHTHTLYFTGVCKECLKAGYESEKGPLPVTSK